jgi:hypothetical protein
MDLRGFFYSFCFDKNSRKNILNENILRILISLVFIRILTINLRSSLPFGDLEDVNTVVLMTFTGLIARIGHKFFNTVWVVEISRLKKFLQGVFEEVINWIRIIVLVARLIVNIYVGHIILVIGLACGWVRVLVALFILPLKLVGVSVQRLVYSQLVQLFLKENR